jgi:TRAP-type C4-dicarboxylate transport system permease large subunit
MAEILSASGVSSRIYAGLAKLVARLPGGLLQTNIAGCAVFASVNGSSIATAATIGGVALPQLLRRGYNRPLAAGSLAAGGTLGILIPPSFPMIVYGTFTETSVPKLFIGVVTTTEAAVVGCVLSIVLGITMGHLTLRGFVQALFNTIVLSGNSLFLILAAYIFSTALSFGGLGEQVTKLIVGLQLSKLEFFLALLVLFTVLGCLIESLGMIVITVPLLYPVLASYGIDPILFGVVLLLFVELGQISPPIGINLFVIQSIWDGKLARSRWGRSLST